MKNQVLWLAAVWLLACFRGSAQQCVPLVTCPALLRDPATHQFNSPAGCFLTDGSQGVTCPGFLRTGEDSNTELTNGYLPPPPRSGYLPPPPRSGYLPPPPRSGYLPPPPTVRKLPITSILTSRLDRSEEVFLQPLTPEEENEVVRDATLQFCSGRTSALMSAVRGENLAQANSAEELQFFFSRPASRTSTELGKNGQNVTLFLKRRSEIGKLFSGRSLQPPLASHLHFQLPDPPASLLELEVKLPLPNCEPVPQPHCGDDTLRFRTHDGSCNNQQDTRLGRSNTAYDRFFPSAYDDGIAAPRSWGAGGSELPSPRLVSLRVGESNSDGSFDMLHTIGLMLFGQFVDHDLTSTPEAALERTNSDDGFTCCHSDGSFPEESLHPLACNPIRVPADDPVFAPKRCMNQVRSNIAPSEDCLPRPATQLNQITHYLDGSNIYGSTDSTSNQLRLRAGGRLRTTGPDDLLPRDEMRCRESQNDCFISGDQRVSENIGLAFLHLVWTREHNRVAAALAARHPDYDDERLYQEARRIVVAEYQHIVYNEFLPAVLGYDFTAETELAVGGDGHSYDPARRAVITSEFSTAAFRFGHSMVHDVFELQSRLLALKDTFFNSSFLFEQGLVRELADSLTTQRPGWVDLAFSNDIREQLFAKPGMPGADLIALNINRGRDHGLQPYITAVENCFDRTVTSWEDLGDLLEEDSISRLRSAFASYEDVDLYIGLVSERRAPGAAVGRTLQCLIGQQFADLRRGDRFFYDNTELPNSFTSEQIAELRRSSLARIYCDNVPGLEQVQPLTFLQPEFFSNDRQHCNSKAIPSLTLSVF